ncbi:MAG: hybrid sensor histidine kinase/response regulator [Chloroflexi bacterium]|nr:hybrid sensor histidine kinase/response regulator [Chloroflexota bacterium]
MTTRVDGLQAEIEELKSSALWLSAAPVIPIAFALYVVATSSPDPAYGTLPGVILLLLAPAVWWLVHKSYYRVAALALVCGLFCANSLLIHWRIPEEAVVFLALPAGLTAVLIGSPAGAAAAVACCIYLLFGVSQVDAVLRIAAAVNLWATLWLIWLSSRPLLLARQWFESNYEQSRATLEKSRDYQFQLRQALDDLTEAHHQLTQLNRLAHDLRHQADEARRSKEQFVANVSHELRTPLNMIIGFSEMALNSPETYGPNIPQSLLADLEIVLRNSQHLSSLIDDVLDLSQIEAGQMALMKERAALSKIVDEAVTAVQPLFNSKGLTLRSDIPLNLPELYCDRVRIRQVLLNLLSNAGRFTARGGVRVRARADEGAIIISVADTGPGIKADEMDEIFKPFQQVDGTIHSHWAGSGLGLSVSKHFVELHKGRMWLESEPGQGATFYFRLPVEEAISTEADGMMRWFSPYSAYVERTRIPSLPASADRPRLIVIEDGRALFRLLARYLDNVEIVPVTSAEEALEAIEAFPAQALLVNAASVGESLGRIENEIALPFGLPVIICSLPGPGFAADSLGADDYLIKPISRDDLLAALDRLEHEVNTILIVDDEPDVLRLFRRMLASAGRNYRVLRASSALQARQIMLDTAPDVVLSDLVMPEQDGYQLIAEMKADPALRDIPIVVTSARDPSSQPTVSKSLAVVRGGGIAIPQLLTAVSTLVSALSPGEVNLRVESGEELPLAEGLAEEAGGAQA